MTSKFDLINIVKDGYNMKVVGDMRESLEAGEVTISIGGSERTFSTSSDVVSQLNDARLKLGCSPLTETDKVRIADWQKSIQ